MLNQCVRVKINFRLNSVQIYSQIILRVGVAVQLNVQWSMKRGVNSPEVSEKQEGNPDPETVERNERGGRGEYK